MDPITAILGIGNKLCSVCKETKTENSFRVRTDTGKYRSFCFSCETQIRKDNYLATRLYRLQKDKEHKTNNPVSKILKQAKETAKRKNLEFNLTEKDIILQTHCKYLGIPLTNILGQGVIWDNYSIDRIDSSKGYIKGNVEIISRKANTMKNMASQEELLIFARNILKLAGEL